MSCMTDERLAQPPLVGAKLSIDHVIGMGSWLVGILSSTAGHAALVGVIIWTSFPAEELQYGAARLHSLAISVSVETTLVMEAAEDSGHQQQAAEALVAMATPLAPPEPEKPKEIEEPKPDEPDAVIEKKEEEKITKRAPPQSVAAAQVSGQGVAQANSGRVSASYGEERAYGAIIRARIARRKPVGVTRHGTTVIEFTIGAGGEISSCRTTLSSGDRDADSASMMAVHESAPFPPPPPGAAPITFAVPFNFY
jgi:TonB family protein